MESVESIDVKYLDVFVEIERIATAIFTVEYVLRVWTAVDVHNGAFRDPVYGRLRYMRSFFAVIDLISILPAALGLIGAGDLRVLRLLRLLRMLKLTRHSSVFSLIWAVLREEAQMISALIFIISLTVTISGALMYMIEGGEQPTVFTSIPAAMWWAIETLTTVGYGDMVPVTAVGKVLGGIVSIIGIGTLALFSGVITVGFLDQLRIIREQASNPHPLSATNGKDTILNETHGVISVAGVAMERRAIELPTPSAGMCPCCGRPMQAAGTGAGLRA